MVGEKTYRIKKGVTPYAGKKLVVRPENEHEGYVSGFVDLGARTPPGLRRYERHEIEELA